MSSNNLYDTLIEMAKMQNIEISETQTARQSESDQLTEFGIKMKQIRFLIEEVRKNNLRILGMKEKLSTNALPSKQSRKPNIIKSYLKKLVSSAMVTTNLL